MLINRNAKGMGQMKILTQARGSRRRSLAMLGLFAALALIINVAPASAAGEVKPPRDHDWSWESGPAGITGTFDRGALQRGLKVYREVCASCHGLKFVAFRNLGDPGGPGFSEAEVKAIAAEYTKEVLDEFGDPVEVPRAPFDHYPSPFANEAQARASNGGAYPPDLSVINKARPGGADYIYSLLVGYKDAPAGFELGEGLSYNPYFKNSQIAMAPPLFDDMVEYDDGTSATVEQMAEDVTTFLMWTAEPKLEERKRTGFMVIIYLMIMAVLLFFTYRKIWADRH